MIGKRCCANALLFFALCGALPIHRIASAQPSDSPLDATVRDLCRKQIAVLGEPPMHGFARTSELKVAIVERLVDQCGYTGIVFESGTYDFLNIERRRERGEPVEASMVRAAIGGLWATAEVAPLVPFLVAKVQTGAIVLGGMDDQLGRGTYAQLEMPKDLVRHLQPGRGAGCLEILERHMAWGYTSDTPYDARARARILTCLDTLAQKDTRTEGKPDAYDSLMIENLRRTIRRDALASEALADSGMTDRNAAEFNDRDRSMYANLQWWGRRAPGPRRVIVWTATTHAAKDLASVPGMEQLHPLGAYLAREFGASAFALGFSALGGSYAMVGHPARLLPPAPPNSLEQRVLRLGGSDVRYVGPERLREFGLITARPVGPDFKSARWNLVFDGLVVVRAERPPVR